MKKLLLVAAMAWAVSNSVFAKPVMKVCDFEIAVVTPTPAGGLGGELRPYAWGEQEAMVTDYGYQFTAVIDEHVITSPALSLIKAGVYFDYDAKGKKWAYQINRVTKKYSARFQDKNVVLFNCKEIPSG